jgi:hypothetical protein
VLGPPVGSLLPVDARWCELASPAPPVLSAFPAHAASQLASGQAHGFTRFPHLLAGVADEAHPHVAHGASAVQVLAGKAVLQRALQGGTESGAGGEMARWIGEAG